MNNKNENFFLSKKQYRYIALYLSLKLKEEIFLLAKKKIEAFLQNQKLSKIDFILSNINYNKINLHYLDFITKFFFKKTLIRYKLNLMLALSEADYDNFVIMLKKNSLIGIIFEFLLFLIIFFTIPFWILFHIFLRIFK